MKLAVRIFGAVLALSIPSVAQANWTDPLTVNGGFVENSDMIVIHTLETTAYGGPGCVSTRYIFYAANDDRRARAWATVLTALTAGRKVRLWYSGSCTAWGYVDVTAILIE